MNKKCYLLGLYLLIGSHAVLAQDPVSATAVQPASVPTERPSMNRSIVELLNRIDQLQKELRQLRGDFEVVNHELTGIKHRQRELYLDMDRRLRDVELASVNATGKGGSIASGTGTNQPKQQPVNKGQLPGGKPLAPTREEKDTYRSAFNLLKEGRYDRSIKSFAAFLVKYPQSTYADNAQYWLGEANYVSRKYKRAVKEFGRVIAAFPDSSKVPDAMLKLGFTHYELKEWAKSRQMLEGVMQNYPKSSAAKLAGTRLKRMQQEGH